MASLPATPVISVIVLLYNAADHVDGLVQAIAGQKHAAFPTQKEWLEVLFMDDRSRDQTLERLDAALARIGNPGHYLVVANSDNLGLSRTLNKAFGMVRSPYALTCHCDVTFARDDYVASMAQLLDEHPEAAAITGQPLIPPALPGKPLPLPERFNIVANLMDVFPPRTESKLVPVGFAEGRCDAFRINALRSVGFYDTALRLAGEDQVLAARLRAKGYEIYQAPELTYFLSVSDEQNTLRKLMKHQMLYGRAHPYIVLKTRNSSAGVIGARAGSNRRSRTFLRGLQVASTAVYVAAVALVLTHAPISSWAIPLFVVFVAKAVLFGRHAVEVRLRSFEVALFYLIQPFLDIAYTFGLLKGFWLLARSSDARPIS